MSWRYGVAFAVVVLVLATTGAPPAQPQLSRSDIGLPCCGLSYPIWNRERDRDFDFAEMRELDVGFVRLDYLYDRADWQAEVQRLSSLASSHGIATTLILGGWMRFDDRPGVSEFEAFARDAATRFSAVTVFEVLNEPDLVGWTPETYVPYLQAAHNGIKAVRPEAVVSTGGISRFGCEASPCPTGTGMVDWVRRMYAAGAAASFDALALHLYDDPLERGAANVWDWAFVEPENVRDVMDGNGDTNVPLWSSENGAPTPKYSVEEQARIVADTIRAVKNQTFPVANVTHYTLQDDDVPGFGLLDPDNARRPAWFGYRDAIRE